MVEALGVHATETSYILRQISYLEVAAEKWISSLA